MHPILLGNKQQRGRTMDERIRPGGTRVSPPAQTGKISIAPTKALTNQQDLSLAYSPGVAACDAIVRTGPAEAATLTAAAT